MKGQICIIKQQIAMVEEVVTIKAAIRYFSRGGNTKKLADAISKEIGVEAKTTSEPLTEDVDILFLGSAAYGFDVDEEVKNFIKGINVRVGEVVNFSTTAVIKSTRKYVSRILKEKNIPLSDSEFACKGAFAVLHKGKPDENDCKNAAQFAKKVLAERNGEEA